MKWPHYAWLLWHALPSGTDRAHPLNNKWPSEHKQDIAMGRPWIRKITSPNIYNLHLVISPRLSSKATPDWGREPSWHTLWIGVTAKYSKCCTSKFLEKQQADRGRSRCIGVYWCIGVRMCVCVCVLCTQSINVLHRSHVHPDTAWSYSVHILCTYVIYYNYFPEISLMCYLSQVKYLSQLLLDIV